MRARKTEGSSLARSTDVGRADPAVAVVVPEAGTGGVWPLATTANAAANHRNLGLKAQSLVYDKGGREVLETSELEERESAVDAAEIPHWLIAVRAAQSKQAEEILVLDLSGITSFTDYFVICTGGNSRQVQAISDEVGLKLKGIGDLPVSLEGYEGAEWILADYGDFLVHVFSPKSREYYSLERLWRAGKVVEIPEA